MQVKWVETKSWDMPTNSNPVMMPSANKGTVSAVHGPVYAADCHVILIVVETLWALHTLIQ